MSAVIKSLNAAGAGHVRAFGLSTAGRPRADRIDPELLAARHELEELREEVAAQRAVLLGRESELKAAYEKGEGVGRQAGRKEADDGRAALAARLDAAAKTAIERLAGEMSSLERLAALLASESLEKILGASEGHEALIQQLIGRQVEALKDQAILRIEVSRADFPDAAQLPELAAGLNRSDLEVRSLSELKSGDCQIRLQLGVVEIGLNQQWAALRTLLAAMAEASP